MNRARFDTLFTLRYAERVLERYARMWHRLDATARVFAIFSGTAAFGALMAQSGSWALVFGGIFALLQALEYGLNPGRREQESRAARALYARVLARQHELTDEQLEIAYQEAQAGDSVIVPDTLRRLAYNDVVDERGCDPAARYALSRLDEVIARIA
jgi:hypothetical protein